MGTTSSSRKSAAKPVNKQKAADLPAGLTEEKRADFRQLLEDVYLLNNRKIFKMSFLRGIAFGFGTFLGGTIVVAIVVWILSQFIDIFPWAHDFTERLINSLNKN